MNQFSYILILVLVILNFVSFLLVGADKKKSQTDSSRIPEVYLFFLASIFGSVGVFIGMFVFHHKTRKLYFPVGIGVLLLQQIALVYLLLDFA